MAHWGGVVSWALRWALGKGCGQGWARLPTNGQAHSHTNAGKHGFFSFRDFTVEGTEGTCIARGTDQAVGSK